MLLYESLADILNLRSSDGNRGITYITGEKHEEFISYRQLYYNSLEVLGCLQSKGIKPGSELIFQIEDNQFFIETFWGCILGGIIPVPVTIGNNDEHRAKLFKIWGILNYPYLVTNQKTLNMILKYARENEPADLVSDILDRTILAENIEKEKTQGEIYKTGLENIAFIQFSSGSTGMPKGVILKHENLLVNSSDLNKSWEVTADDSTLSWMPLTHDMGLIAVHITSLVAGINQYIMPTTLFVRQPTLWLKKAFEHRVTQLYSPNFGYKHFLTFFQPEAAKDWDLSSVRIIVNGAEPIYDRLCNEFLDKMAQYGLKRTSMLPGFGLAEGTVGVTFARVKEELVIVNIKRSSLNIGGKIIESESGMADSVAFVDVGYPVENCSVRICDDKGILEEGRIGYIHIKGNNVTSGYYNNKEAALEVITKDGWLNTGDLGYLRNGRLVITGRSKDIIFINGQNYYPHDIERVAENVEGIELGKIAACGVFNESVQREEVILFVLFKKKPREFVETALNLKKYVNLYMGIEISAVVPVKKIPKTTSGKVQRYKIGEMYQRGEFSPVLEELDEAIEQKFQKHAEDIPIDTFEEKLIDICKDVLGVKNIGLKDSIVNLGANSLQLTMLAGRIYAYCGIDLPITQIYKSPAIEGIISYIKCCRPEKVNNIGQETEREYYSLSSMQKRMYALDNLEGIGITYNVPVIMKVDGLIDEKLIEAAFKKLIDRHEILRTSFGIYGGEPIQKVHKNVDFEMEYEECSFDEAGFDKEIDRAAKNFIRPFDLSKSPLMRVKLLRFMADKHVLIVDMHHIITDGTSMGILMKEFSELYMGKELPDLKIQYKDFAAYQENLLTSESMRRQEKFWLDRFKGEIPVLDMPTDFKRPAERSFNGEHVKFRLDKNTVDNLKRLSSNSGATMFMILLGIYNILLSRYSGQDDIVVGSPIAGRIHHDTENMMGMFINTLALRNNPEAYKTFIEFIKILSTNTLNAYENQDYQLEMLIESLGVKRNTTRNPVFDTVFVLQNMGIPKITIDGIDFNYYPYNTGVSMFDITLQAIEAEDEIDFTLDFNTALFKRKTMERLAGHFINIAKCISENPEIRISDIEMLSAVEKWKLLNEFNNTGKSCSIDNTVHELFEKQAASIPDKQALVYKGAVMTYGQLNDKSNKLAGLLREKGVGTESIVPVMTTQSFEMFIGILGILKAGGAYLPIDPEYPQERIRYMLGDSGAGMLLAQSQLSESLELDVEIINLDNEKIYERDALSVESIYSPSSLAYVIYTSGSTGKPKGVMVEHKSLINLCRWHNEYYEITDFDRSTKYAGFGFDASVWEIFPYLISGATIYIIGEDIKLDICELDKFYKENGITISFLPTQAGEQFANIHTGNSLRALLVGGDKLKAYNQNNFAIVNNYGPTENTVVTTSFVVDRHYDNIPVGKPVYNTKVYIVGNNDCLQPVGVPGELCISGFGLARGYLNRPELTKEKFVACPFEEGQRMYRTGDLARWLPDGNIEFLGRIDSQVKVRGYRIEIGEVENRLLEYEQILEALVELKEDAGGNKHICAYIISEKEIDIRKLNAFLGEELPVYMIPVFYIRLTKMPITANGKVDRKALPVPDFSQIVNKNTVAPRNETESRLLEIWCEELKLNNIGVTDNFFELGGHSILIMKIIARISNEFNTEVSFKEFTRNNTIEGLAGVIAGKAKDNKAVIYPKKEQNLENIYLPFPLTEVQMAYLMGRDDSFELGGVSTHGYLEVELDIDIKLFNESLVKLINRHPMLRTIILSDGNQQILSNIEGYDIGIEDVYNMDSESQRARILAERKRMSEHVFSTDKWPLFEFKAFRLDESGSKYYLCVSFDPLIADASSVKIIIRELVDLYKNPQKVLEELKFTFRDYMIAYSEFKNSDTYKSDKQFWMDKLEEFQSAPALPLKNNPADIKQPSFRRHHFDFPSEQWEILKKRAKDRNITPSSLLCTAYAEVLAYYSSQPKLAINMTVFNRYPFHKDVDKIVGDFTSVMLVGTDMGVGSTFWDRASGVQESIMEALGHRHFDGVEFVREISRYNDMMNKAVMPIVFTSVLFDGENSDSETEIDYNKAKTTITRTSQVFIDNQAVELNGNLSITWDYVEELFEPEVISGMFESYLSILNDIIESGDAGKLKLNETSCRIIENYNSSFEDIMPSTLQELFENQVLCTPENEAVVFEGEAISYRELDEKSTQIARYLLENGVVSGDFIGVLAKRNIKTIINVMGALKAGAAYVPVDPEYPQDRKEYILDNSNCKLLLEPEFYTEKGIAVYSTEKLNQVYTTDSIAYVIYTSGSTGRPKGVVITHGAVTNTIKDINSKFNVNARDRIIGLSSMCFDLSVYDIFGALGTGAALVLVRDQRDVSNLAETLLNERITIWNSVPAIMDMMLENVEDFYNSQYLRLVMLSGDWIPLKLPEKIEWHFENAEIISLGGATEASVWSIYYPINGIRNEWKSIPYGYPLANQSFYVLNYKMEPCPIGVHGELYIGGAGLASGYLNDEEKTRNSFIKHPVIGSLYKTGDYGVMHKEGYIEFLGRKDHQVKIRGYRIELGEIESRLSEHDLVKNAVVIDRSESNGRKYLCAYFISDEELTVSELREFLLKKLPEYMVPAYFIQLEMIPLTPNGKVDRKCLPEPEMSSGNDQEYPAPANETEKRLVAICSEVLGIGKIGTNDSFFELGVNSILMMQIRTKISKTMKVEINFREFLEANSVVKLAGLISTKEQSVQKSVYHEVKPDKENVHLPFPLTDVQLAYLMGRGDQFELGGISTHGYTEIETRLNISRLSLALQRLIKRQPMLRAVILPDGTQKILQDVRDYVISYEDISQLDRIEQNRRILVERERMSHYVFKTDQWPLFEFKAFKISSETNYLLVGLDLLIGDGASMQILVRELMDFYKNPDDCMPDIGFTFRDYILACNKFESSEIYNKDKKYWMDKLEDFPQAPVLPLRCDPSGISKPHFKRQNKVFEHNEWEILKKKARENNVTPSALLCTAYAEVLAKWSNQPRLAINSTVFSRYPFNENVNKIIGDFTSVMLLDITMKPNATFWEKAVNVQGVLMEALEHRHYDGIKFIREISKYNNMGTRAVMPIVFTSMLFNDKSQTEDRWQEFGDIKMAISQTSQVFIDHQVMEMNGGLSLTWDYVEELFDEEVIGNMFEQYIGIIENLINEKDECHISAGVVFKALLEKYNDTDENIISSTIHGLFAEQARRTPENEAVVFENDSITYRELDEKSNMIARYLVERGVGRNDLIGVLAERRIYTIINVMGILKAGGAYVPVDPEYPEDRRNYIMENSNCKMLLNPSFYSENGIDGYSADPLSVQQNIEDLAYVIYTSGSTGRPKGVAITHKAASNTIIDINSRYNVNESDRIIGLSSMCFDLSVYDIFGALSTGAALVMVKDQRDVTELAETLKTQHITIWNSVPAIMDMMLDNIGTDDDEEVNYWSNTSNIISFSEDWSLRLVLLSGDWIPLKLPERIEKQFTGVEIVSLGGATEASIWSIYYPVNGVEEHWKSIPYGYPLKNQKFYVLDYEMQICPVGVPGELYIGGVGIAKGYYGDAEKTAVAFLNHTELGDLYRTGDFGVMHKEGYIEFLGRKDHQVKIRGYRIELGEIESRLLENEAVKNAVVIDRVDDAGKKYLCAYVVMEDELNITEIRDYLGERLPHYMVPQYFIDMDEIPLTPNGKIDRKSLPEPDGTLLAAVEYVAPRNKIEDRLAKIWEEVLKTERIGIHDNFLEAGGNSIMMVQIVTRIAAEFKADITYREFISRNTIAKLAELVSENSKSNQLVYPKVEPDMQNIGLPFPLTEIQTAYLMGRNELFEMGGVSTHGYSEFETRLDMKRFGESLKKLIARHPMMRAIVLPDGRQQILTDVPDYVIDIKDISKLSAEEQEQCILEERNRMSHYIFKTDVWPLFEFKAFKISEEIHYLFIGFDLLIADGASMLMLGRELIEFYNNSELDLPKLEFTFRDYMLTYSELKNSDTYKLDKEYWMSKLDEFPSSPALPMRRDPSAVSKPHFKRHNKLYSVKDWDKLKKWASQHNITPSVLLCSAFVRVLSAWSNQPHLAVNLTVFNRYPFHRDVNMLVGDFTSVMPLDIRFVPNCTFWDMASDVQNTLMEALEHRHFDGVEFTRELSRARGMGTKAVLPIVFTSMLLGDKENADNKKYELGTEKMRISQTSQVYIDHQVMETGGELSLIWDYVEELFEHEVIDGMFEQYTGILSEIIETGNTEKMYLLETGTCWVEEYNKTCDNTIIPTTLQQLFMEQARKTPYREAVVDGRDFVMYSELDRRSNQVAHCLIEKGVCRNDFVGVLAYRSIASIINVMGVLKAGAAYVPIDPDYPEDRKNYILENSNCKLILEPEFYLENNLVNYSSEAVDISYDINDTAYVIYTSGSTGRPKGVTISQKAVTNTVIDINRKFNVSENDRIIGLSSMCFDLSVYDIFGSLSTGAALIIVKDQRDVISLAELLKEQQITVWNSVPAIMDMMVDHLDRTGDQEEELQYWHSGRMKDTLIAFNDLSSLRLVMLSGDWIPLALPGKIKKHFASADIISLGGATEASIWSIYYPVTEVRKEWNSIPYGIPLANQEFYVLDYEMKVCAPWVQGELFIGGKGLAEGYLNDLEKTQNAFIDHPELGRLYRTGDQGKFVKNGGYIEFLGRRDYQVKISGYRIELGEIETRLSETPSVKNVVVIDRVDENKKKYLCAYIVSDSAINVEELKEHLSGVLPEYMIPRYFVQIQSIPLTPNGKIDRKALPEPGEEMDAGQRFEMPVGETETRFVEIWQEILGVERIGVTDSLFDIGASSSNIIVFVSKVYAEFKVKYPLEMIFRYPFIRNMAEYIEKSFKSMGTAKECVLLNNDGRKKVFFFPPILSLGIVYKGLASAVNSSSVYSFDFIEDENVVDKYVETIVDLDREGPYVLCGHSAGGNVAFEVAKKLESTGRSVSDIIMMDSYFVKEDNKRDELLSEAKEIYSQRIIDMLLTSYAHLDISRKDVDNYVGRKVKAYIEFLNSLITIGEVNANIHFIWSEGDEAVNSSLRENMGRWNLLTKGNFKEYQGFGIHDDMLGNEFAARNAELFESILKLKK